MSRCFNILPPFPALVPASMTTASPAFLTALPARSKGKKPRKRDIFSLLQLWYNSCSTYTGRLGKGSIALKKYTPKKIRSMFWAIWLAGFIIGLAGPLCEIAAFSVTGIIIMVGSGVFYLVFYRCPDCGKFLGRNTGEYCPYCGKAVNK